MKKVLKFVKTKRNRSSSSLEVVNTDSMSCSTKIEQDDDYDSQTNKSQFESLVSELHVSDQIEKSLKDDIISVLSTSDKDLSTISSSPQSARIPPPLKPLRSLEFLHSETFNKNELQNLKSNLVILGTVRTRHISFTETPQISGDNTGEIDLTENSNYLNDWSSEKSLPLSSAVTTRTASRLSHSANRHFKRYSLDYNFKSKYPLIQSEQPINEDFKPDLEQLETYDDALKHLEKCDLNQIHQKSRSLPRNTEAPLFNSYTELNQNSYSLPRSLTTTDSFQSTFKNHCERDSLYEYPFLKKPFLKHFKNIFDYKKNFKRGRRLVKSFSFTKSTEDYSDEIKKYTSHQKDESTAQNLSKKEIKETKLSNQECTKSQPVQNLKTQLCEKSNCTSVSSENENNSNSCSTTKELKNEVIQWKEQYDEVLKRIQNVDSREIGNLFYANSMEFATKDINKVTCKSDNDSALRNIYCQPEIDEVVNILKKQYDKVEDILTKQNDKLEIMVQKLNTELSTNKRKELNLEKKLSKMDSFDMIEICISGKENQSNSITLVVKQNQIISEAIQKLKEFLKEYQSEVDIFSVQVASGETLCEKLATLEIENSNLRKRMSKLEKESIMSCDPSGENNIFCNLTKNCQQGGQKEITTLENKLKEYEQIIDSQKREIEKFKENETKLLKRLEFEQEMDSLKVLLTKQNNLVEKFTVETDNLKTKLSRISDENRLLTQRILSQEKIIESNINKISELESELNRKTSQIKLLMNQQLEHKNNSLEIQLTELNDDQKLLQQKLDHLKDNFIQTKKSSKDDLEIPLILAKLQDQNSDLKFTILQIRQSVDEKLNTIISTNRHNHHLNQMTAPTVNSLIKSQSIPVLLTFDKIQENKKFEIKKCQSLGDIKTSCEQTSVKDFKDSPKLSQQLVLSSQKHPKSPPSKIKYSREQQCHKLQQNVTSPKYGCHDEPRIQIWDHLNDCSDKWQYNIEIIKHLCDELTDIKRYLTKSSGSTVPEQSSNYQLDDFHVKINQLQRKINEENTRHYECQPVKTSESKLEENNRKYKQQTNECQFEEIEKKLRDQFETTKKRLEEDLLAVQTKLDEKYKQQVTQMRRCQEIISNRSHSDSLLSNNIEFNSFIEHKSSCNLQCVTCGNKTSSKNYQEYSNSDKNELSSGNNPMLEYYRQHLDKTLRKTRTNYK